MGILDPSGIQRIQENLLNKGFQNKAFTLRLAKTLVIARYIQNCVKNNALERLIDDVENTELCIEGFSRAQFLKSLESNINDNVGKLEERK